MNKTTLSCPAIESNPVILDCNPLSVDPDAIEDIRVVETIKAGRTIDRREAGR